MINVNSINTIQESVHIYSFIEIMSCDDDIKCFLGEHICSQGSRGANVTKSQILNYTNIDQKLCTKDRYQV